MFEYLVVDGFDATLMRAMCGWRHEAMNVVRNQNIMNVTAMSRSGLDLEPVLETATRVHGESMTPSFPIADAMPNELERTSGANRSGADA